MGEDAKAAQILKKAEGWSGRRGFGKASPEAEWHRAGCWNPGSASRAGRGLGCPAAVAPSCRRACPGGGWHGELPPDAPLRVVLGRHSAAGRRLSALTVTDEPRAWLVREDCLGSSRSPGPQPVSRRPGGEDRAWLWDPWAPPQPLRACRLSSCATPWGCSTPGSSVRGSLQARTLEWVTEM